MPTKILAIDDSKTMRLAIKITFAAEDADVTSVSKGSDAVARAKQMGADVVLVDASLAAGEPSGYDVCRALKHDAATAGIPVVLLVSGQTGVDEAKLAESGGDDWLAKPFDTQELIDKVAAVRGKASVGAVARPTAAAAAAVTPRPAAAAAATRPEPDASASGSRRRPENRTQMGMPTPAPAAAAAAAPVPRTTRPAAAKPAVSKPAAGLASKPIAPSRTVAGSAPATSTTARPARAAAPATAMTPATAAVGSGGPIPIAIPIPFTAADSPTPGMIERLQQAVGTAGVDPRVAEAIASLSREVIEKIAWEVVPELAESIIRAQQARSA